MVVEIGVGAFGTFGDFEIPTVEEVDGPDEKSDGISTRTTRPFLIANLPFDS